MYTQALFYAFLVTPLAYVHKFLICNLSIYICWNWTLLLCEYQWGNNIVFTRMQDNSNLRQPPRKTFLPRENVFIQRIKTYAKRKYFTINLIHSVHKACQILSTFSNRCHCHHLHLHCHSTTYQHQFIPLQWIYSTS